MQTNDQLNQGDSEDFDNIGRRNHPKVSAYICVEESLCDPDWFLGGERLSSGIMVIVSSSIVNRYDFSFKPLDIKDDFCQENLSPW